MIPKGSWVRIKSIVLPCTMRSKNIPIDTQKTDLCQWEKGWLLEDAILNDTVSIQTVTGRTTKGILLELNPTFHHDYGDFLPELKKMDQMILKARWGDTDEIK